MASEAHDRQAPMIRRRDTYLGRRRVGNARSSGALPSILCPMEIDRAKRDTTSLRDWKADVCRLVATGVLTIVALATPGWPSGAAAAWITLGVAVLAFVVVLALEFAWNVALAPLRGSREENALLRGENAALRETANELDGLKRQRELLERQLLVANRTIAVQEVAIEVWGGAYREAANGKSALPLAAVLARREVMLKARNIEKPLPPE